LYREANRRAPASVATAESIERARSRASCSFCPPHSARNVVRRQA
jgi:hypothetical protein